MRRSGAALLVTALLMAAIPVTGEGQENVAVSSQNCGQSALNPPCGYVNPWLFLDLPDNKRCGANLAFGESVDPATCLTPPVDGKPIVMEGQFRLTWEVSEEATYPADQNDPMVVSFHSISTNPGFISWKTEPASYTLDATTLNNPAYHTTKEAPDGSTAVWYEYTAPITVTFTRNGEPNTDDIERLTYKDGLSRVAIRIHSDSSGSNFQDSYGLVPFNFHIGNADPSDQSLQLLYQSLGITFTADGEVIRTNAEAQNAPAASSFAILAVLGAAVMLLRRG